MLLGCLISEVNFIQPSLLAVIIAFLYSLLSEVYRTLPVGFLFLASFLHFEQRMVRFSSHHDGYLYFLLKIFLGIVLVRVAVRIFKNHLIFPQSRLQSSTWHYSIWTFYDQVLIGINSNYPYRSSSRRRRLS